MGQAVYTKAMELNEIEVVAGVDKFVTGEEKVPVFDDISKINVDIDVIIDFSIPIATFNILEFAANKKIRFQYFQWNTKKEMELRRDGAFYEISPWALSWDDENYYMIGFDAEENKIKHFRVDKILKICCLEAEREGRELFQKFDMADYSRKSFGMFGGEEQCVKLLCHNSLAGVVIDRFGKDVILMPVDANHFRINVNVAVSEPFFGWVFALGDKVKIEGPEGVVAKMKEMLKSAFSAFQS